MKLRSLSLITAALLPLAGCVESEGPAGPRDEAPATSAPAVVNTLLCQATVSTGEVSCTDPELGDPGSASGAILGGQGVYVLLESSSPSYDSTTETFSVSVAVRNFLGQPLGTTDGVSADPAGIRIFFAEDPQTVVGSGAITVQNADSTAEFTASDQPYFQYTGPVAPGVRSGVRAWRWNVPTTVEAFSFLVGVSAAVPDEGSVDPARQLDAIAVSAGDLHTCALDADGKAYCWGDNSKGQLGDGTTENRAIPTPVSGDLRFKAISAGFEHTCAIAVDGKGYCWGGAQWGRLGNSSSGANNLYLSPARIDLDAELKTISATSSNTCAVTVDGEGYCWGHGLAGRIGNGELEHQFTPTKVAGDHEFTMIAAGHNHICGLTTSNDTYCWGSAVYGRLGNGELSGTYSSPVPVQGGHKFVTITSATYSSCGITADGETYCWGNNGSISTRLGNGTVNDTIPYPVPVLGGHTFTQVAAAEFHGCALDQDGKAFCWGRGQGRRGDGVSGDINATEPVAVSGNHRFKAIHTSKSHTCAIDLAGKVFCWGQNGDSNRIGVGNTNPNIAAPRLVSPIAE